MKRQSEKYLIDKAVKLFFQWLALVVFLFISFVGEVTEEVILKETMPVLIILGLVFVIIFAISMLYQVFLWQKTYYYLKDEEIEYKSNFIFKKNVALKYHKIHTIDVKQNIIQRILNIKTLSLDSGATTNHLKSEIRICDTNQIIDNIEKRIRSKMNGEEAANTPEIINNMNTTVVNPQQDKPQYIYSTKQKIILSIIGCCTTAIVLTVLFLLCMSIGVIILRNNPSIIFKILISFVIIFLLFEFFIWIVSFVGYAISLYDYKVLRKGNYIYISYGLFVKSKFALNIDKIKSVQIDYGVIKRLFKIASIKLECVGYNNFNGSQQDQQQKTNSAGLFIPFCKTSEINSILAAILPEYLPIEKQYQAPKRSLRYFIVGPILTLLLIVAFCLLATALIMSIVGGLKYFGIACLIGLIILVIYGVLIVICGFIRHSNSGIGISDDLFTIYYGFSKFAKIINKKNFIGLETLTTPFRKKKAIASYTFHFYNNNLANEIKVKMLEDNLALEIEQHLKF